MLGCFHRCQGSLPCKGNLRRCGPSAGLSLPCQHTESPPVREGVAVNRVGDSEADAIVQAEVVCAIGLLLVPQPVGRVVAGDAAGCGGRLNACSAAQKVEDRSRVAGTRPQAAARCRKQQRRADPAA